jgi:hypothetical protein
MIRKAFIILLTLAAVAVIVGYVLSELLLLGTDCICMRNLATGVGWHLQLDSGCPSSLCVSGRGGNLHLSQIGHGHVDDCGEIQVSRSWRYEFLGVRTQKSSGLFTSRESYLLYSDCWCQDHQWFLHPFLATVRVPFLYLFLAFITYPTIAFICGPLRRWRRRRKGLCLKCAYNLTGNVSGVCPECGKAI